MKKSRFIIFLKEIYTKDKFSCWLSVCMMLLSTFFVIFLPKLLQYIIDESMRGQQIKYILFFGGLYFFISLFNSLIIIKKEGKRQIASTVTFSGGCFAATDI